VIAKRCPLILTFSPEGEKEIAPVLSEILSYPTAAFRIRIVASTVLTFLKLLQAVAKNKKSEA